MGLWFVAVVESVGCVVRLAEVSPLTSPVYEAVSVGSVVLTTMVWLFAVIVNGAGVTVRVPPA